MTAGLELVAAREWIYGTLAGDATLAALIPGGVHDEGLVALDDSAISYPLVMMSLVSPGADVAAVGAYRIMADPLFAIRGIARARDWGGALAQIAARIDTLLHGQFGAVDNGQIISCVREAPFSIMETDTDRKTEYRHLGGLYRIQAR